MSDNTQGKDNQSSPDVADDTASSSSRGEESDDEEPSYDGDENPMPLLSYTRLFGSLPRRSVPIDANQDRNVATQENHSFEIPSTCAAMAQVNLSKQNNASTAIPTSGAGAPSSSPEISTDQARTPETRRGSPQSQHVVAYGDPLLSQQLHYVMALGYANGSVDLVDPRTGVAVVSSQQLKLRDSTHHQQEAVVDLSMDSTGSFLAAIDTGRMAVIWEFQYTIALQSMAENNNERTATHPSPRQQETPSTPAESGVFSSFMSALTLGGSTPTATPVGSSDPGNPEPSNVIDTETSCTNIVARLAVSSVQLSRITYPKSFGVPTCIAIDPSYNRKRDKAVLVGFLDGRLVLTKRGLIFQRRTDAIIYQGTYHENSLNHQGIEAIAWRGSLAAWADASGIRLFDTDSLTRIAHIDRPTGARTRCIQLCHPSNQIYASKQVIISS